MNKDELIQNELALTIANLSYERARYKAEAELLSKQVRNLQAIVDQPEVQAVIEKLRKETETDGTGTI
ncbi:TPA: hypothetical protein ACGO7F_000771 [Streptococcus suis]|nr:hypothetical protein [Streptococcus suis]